MDSKTLVIVEPDASTREAERVERVAVVGQIGWRTKLALATLATGLVAAVVAAAVVAAAAVLVIGLIGLLVGLYVKIWAFFATRQS